jgi:hypothetical protein
MRPLCKNCKKKPAAINYRKENKVYYRSKCESCSRYNGVGKGSPRWSQHGYEKKEYCEKCGFKSRYQEQFDVYHIDGDLGNCRPSNLKTICANCQRILQKEGVRWKQGDLVPDF